MARRPYTGRTTSAYGPRARTIAGASTFHQGVDGVGGYNTAPEAGVLISYRYTGGWGNLIRFRGDSGTVHYLAHNATRGLLVPVGSRQSEGAPLGIKGMTGTATGVHVHWETRPGGGKPIDPEVWLRNQGGTASSGTTPIEEEEDMMKIIAPYGLPNKGVIAPGFGYAFPDSGQFAHFLNVWEMGSADSVPVTTVGGPSWSAEQNREVFYLLINIHRQGSSYPFQTGTATVDTTALAEALAPLIAGGATAEQIAAKVDAILKDDFAAVTDAIPTQFTITGK